MPPLFMLGWNCGFGSDDLVLPAALSSAIELLWFVGASVAFYYGSDGNCFQWTPLMIYYILSLVIGILIFINDVTLAFMSGRGRIMDVGPRRWVPTAISFRLILSLMRMAADIYGTYQAFGVVLDCGEYEAIVLRVLVVIRWSLFTSMIIALVITLDLLGYKRNSNSSLVWEKRCRSLYCCSGGVDESVFKNIARLLALMFGKEDLVLSDVLVGLLLLEDQDADKITRFAQQHADTSSEIEGNIPSWMSPDTASKYLKYALGCYGWPLYMFLHLGTGLCRLCPEISCCGCCHCSGKTDVGDNCCECHTAALKKFTGLKDNDIIFTSFHNKVYEVPFYVAVAHELSSIIVGIRGTLSLVDVLTDLTANEEDTTGLPENFQAHKGIVQAADFVYKQLNENGALIEAMNKFPDYKVTVTGHSLGAGTAAILATRFRMESRFSDRVYCICFSPPSVLMSQLFVEYTQDFIMSVVVGHDIIALLSYDSINDLKRRLITSLKQCPDPKYKVLLCQCLECICCKESSHLELGEDPPDPTDIEGSAEVLPKMYVPGKILHIYFQDRDRKKVSARWESWRAFQKFVVTPAMFLDHMPQTVSSALEKLLFEHEGNPCVITGVGGFSSI